MALFLGVFIIWLALQGRLKVYGDFATSGPGIGLFNNPTGALNPLQPGSTTGIVNPPTTSPPTGQLGNSAPSSANMPAGTAVPTSTVQNRTTRSNQVQGVFDWFNGLLGGNPQPMGIVR